MLHRAMILMGAAALSACATPVVRDGTAWPDQAGAFRDRSFFMARDGNAPDLVAARQAVKGELVRRGFRERDDAPYRVDVGFAIAPGRIAVQAGDDVPRASPPPVPALCRRRQFVLSVAMMDRADGQVLLRGSAKARRCTDSAVDIIPELARVAIAG